MPRGINKKLSKQRRDRIDKYLINRYGTDCQWCFLPINRSLMGTHFMSWVRVRIVSWSRGGNNELANFLPMHSKCMQERTLKLGLGQD